MVVSMLQNWSHSVTVGLASKHEGNGLDEEDQQARGARVINRIINDGLDLPQGPITRSRSKKLQQALSGFFQGWANKESPFESPRSTTNGEHQDWTLFTLTKVQVHKESS